MYKLLTLGHGILFLEILSVLFKTTLPTNHLSFEIWTFLHILHLKAKNKMFFLNEKYHFRFVFFTVKRPVQRHKCLLSNQNKVAFAVRWF